MFSRLSLEGAIDAVAGDADVKGGLYGLTLSDTVRQRLPAEFGPSFDAMALKSGEIDLELKKLAYRPGETTKPKLDYDVQALLHNGVCECPKLPFPINRLSAKVGVKNGVLTIDYAEGGNGSTTVRAKGTMAVGDPETAPLDLQVDVLGLELDQRVKDRTPPEYLELWDVFKPEGRVDALVALLRRTPGGPIGVGATFNCRDVAAVYRHFPYPLKNLNGTLKLEKRQLTVDLQGPVGDKPARMTGTIDDPGPDAVVNLDIEAESVPIDKAFLGALPPEVRPWVDRFNPAGAVKGKAHIFRKPLVGPNVNPEGQIAVDAELDLNGRCEITWDELPYTVRNLSGRLEIHPDLWVFSKMVGRNGQALITGAGRIEKLPGPDLPNGDPPLKIDLDIAAANLPFNDDLRKSLQAAWQKSWAIINPSGASDVTAKVRIEPNTPDNTRITISPRPESGIRLVVPKAAEPGVEPGQKIELRMDDALGQFEFVNGKVAMRGVTFRFHGAPVQFAEGQVEVKDSGQFDLAVSDLWVQGIRLDSDLRRIMPSLMAQFAHRLDDGHPFTARGNLQIGWSGRPDDLAFCSWDHTNVFFINNSIEAGIPLKHIQGSLKDVSGKSNGQQLEVHGIMDLGSVSFAGLQITQLEGPIDVQGGVARLRSLRGKLLGGELFGDGEITLDDTPRYKTSLSLTAADLQEYARSLPGRQSFSGVVNAAVEFNGLGSDIRSMQGNGKGSIREGDIGKLPVMLRFFRGINQTLSPGASPRGGDKTALFDSADLEFQIVNGFTTFNSIKLTGPAFSLQGKGTRDPLDNLDLRLEPVYGRGRFEVPIFTDLLRGATGQLMSVNIKGTLTQPQPSVKLAPGPQLPRLGDRRNRE
ncbi:MAG: AsmA-like C-terminal region-containing protein [Paludisphaera borealis]|uniref:AsmA family protein n=1 Tax=Paludisphaera borealis TaxID=1387353 RepID=UPI002847DFB2|nr:AsmA-like C-terminal region-containing protein [Paludisphaera borealis]MDR3622485.1 AsmA-like C-terminal region-containing protein [Paludisphaera borealis]